MYPLSVYPSHCRHTLRGIFPRRMLCKDAQHHISAQDPRFSRSNSLKTRRKSPTYPLFRSGGSHRGGIQSQRTTRRVSMSGIGPDLPTTCTGLTHPEGVSSAPLLDGVVNAVFDPHIRAPQTARRTRNAFLVAASRTYIRCNNRDERIVGSHRPSGPEGETN